MNNLFDLTGKVALITGGTHGIGMAIGKILGQAGAKICINDLSAEKLEACKVDYAALGIDVYTLVFDVTNANRKPSALNNIFIRTKKQISTVGIIKP